MQFATPALAAYHPDDVLYQVLDTSHPIVNSLQFFDFHDNAGTLYALEVPAEAPIGAKARVLEARIYCQLETAVMSDFALHTQTNDLFLVSTASRALEQYQVSADGNADRVAGVRRRRADGTELN